MFGLRFHLRDQDSLPQMVCRPNTAVHSQLVQKRLLLLGSARAAIVAGDADLANLVLTHTLR